MSVPNTTSNTFKFNSLIHPTFIEEFSSVLDCCTDDNSRIVRCSYPFEKTFFSVSGNSVSEFMENVLIRKITIEPYEEVIHVVKTLINKENDDSSTQNTNILFTQSCIYAFYEDGQREMCALDKSPEIVWPGIPNGLFVSHCDTSSLVYLRSPFGQEMPINIAQKNLVFQQLNFIQMLNYSDKILFIAHHPSESMLYCFAFDASAIGQNNVNLHMDLAFKLPAETSLSIQACLYDGLDGHKRVSILTDGCLRLFLWEDKRKFTQIGIMPALDIVSIHALFADKLDLIVRTSEWNLNLYFSDSKYVQINVQAILQQSEHEHKHRITRGVKKKGRILSLKQYQPDTVFIQFAHEISVTTRFDFSPGSQLVNDCLMAMNKSWKLENFETFLADFLVFRFGQDETNLSEWEIFITLLFAMVNKDSVSFDCFFGIADDAMRTCIDAIELSKRMTKNYTENIDCFRDLINLYKHDAFSKCFYKNLVCFCAFWNVLSGDCNFIREFTADFPLLKLLVSNLDHQMERKIYSIDLVPSFENDLKQLLDLQTFKDIVSGVCRLSQEQLGPLDLFNLKPSSKLILAETFHLIRIGFINVNFSPNFANLVGRGDLAAMINGKHQNIFCTKPNMIEESLRNTAGPINLKLLQDNRLDEIERIFSLNRVHTIKHEQMISSNDLAQLQQDVLINLAQQKFAMLIGRGMVEMCTNTASPLEKFPIALPEVAVRFENSKMQVKLDKKQLAHGYLNWPLFHAGVAAALSIKEGSEVDGSWIVYNRPETLDPKHAGFILGLGLNGMLHRLKPFHEFEYLNCKHELTSIGILLGLAASNVGSESERLTRIVSIHLPALLPPNSTHLNRSLLLQTAAIVSLGLLHQSSANLCFSSVALEEIGRREMLSCDSHSTYRESYCLAAGFCLGNINLGSGLSHLGDQAMITLKKYIHGGKQSDNFGHRSNSRFKEFKDAVNVDITAPGAIAALALAYLKSNDVQIASILSLPNSMSELEMWTPERVLLSVIGRSLILWQSISPTDAFIRSTLPSCVLVGEKNMNKGFDMECITGACFSMALKYASSGNPDACRIIHGHLRSILPMVSQKNYSSNTINARSLCIKGQYCLDILCISLGILMAGTGDLESLKLLRSIRPKSGQDVAFSSHFIIHTSLGLLFLGKGRFSLGTSNKAISALLMSFFPRFPSSTSDNRPHLQALRNFWFVAVESRLLTLRDVDTGADLSAQLRIHMKDCNQVIDETPCVLPELSSISYIELFDNESRFYPVLIDLNRADQLDYLKRNKIIPVKRRFQSEFFDNFDDVVKWFDTCENIEYEIEIITKFYDRSDTSSLLLSDRQVIKLILALKKKHLLYPDYPKNGYSQMDVENLWQFIHK